MLSLKSPLSSFKRPSIFSRLFRAVNPVPAQGAGLTVDPAFRRLMVYLFVGTRGGQNRVRIVETLKLEPTNPNKLSQKLGLDYKTVQHHLKMLEENGVIVPNEKGAYGAVFFLTPYFEKYFDTVKQMWGKFGQS